MGNFIDKDDLKTELDISGTDSDTLLDLLASSVESLWDDLTERIWFTGSYTEIHNGREFSNRLFLKNFPVTSITSIHDDTDRVYGDDTLIDSEDYSYDPDTGIVYYDSYFNKWNQNIQVIYGAGYTVSNIPKGIKQILVRQACHWFSQADKKKWDKSSQSTKEGGTVAFTKLTNNLLPDFSMMVLKHGRNDSI